ncbi:MAG: hypothetical protein WCG48_03015 [Candidatus Berkelbacteria bacterium]
MEPRLNGTPDQSIALDQEKSHEQKTAEARARFIEIGKLKLPTSQDVIDANLAYQKLLEIYADTLGYPEKLYFMEDETQVAYNEIAAVNPNWSAFASNPTAAKEGQNIYEQNFSPKSE